VLKEGEDVTSTAIRVENLSKKYVLGRNQQGQYKTLRESLTEGARSALRFFNSNDSTSTRRANEEFWALKDISFEINQGDRVGILGRNGAGKSTLLKILSRITEQTKGRITMLGRVASLLEVGTGFHPELTGRENIFLNGAILGMTKAEIRHKFDEIVAFAEVEKFLDTPVKRYSSGMYVRLAFAVAAHLEPEILVVDEVLAVGDTQFQKKCLGKMQDVSQTEGRTVLFVSHNMDAIQRLCSRCLFLERGHLTANGETASCIAKYLSNATDQAAPNNWFDLSTVQRQGTGAARFKAVQFSSLNAEVANQPYSDGPLDILLKIVSDSHRIVGSIGVTVFSQSGTSLVNADIVSLGQTIRLQEGQTTVMLKIESLHLNPGIYTVALWLSYLGSDAISEAFDFIESAFEIEVVTFVSSEPFEQLGMGPYGVVSCQYQFFEVP
jgi:lipopolysaccharide transport system ATP-binding protein